MVASSAASGATKEGDSPTYPDGIEQAQPPLMSYMFIRLLAYTSTMHVIPFGLADATDPWRDAINAGERCLQAVSGRLVVGEVGPRWPPAGIREDKKLSLTGAIMYGEARRRGQRLAVTLLGKSSDALAPMISMPNRSISDNQATEQCTPLVTTIFEAVDALVPEAGYGRAFRKRWLLPPSGPCGLAPPMPPGCSRTWPTAPSTGERLSTNFPCPVSRLLTGHGINSERPAESVEVSISQRADRIAE
ncbi:MAG TPA: hypothetical protein VMW65_09790 [Chloroflexota bacterium]|nr:hypothetical protein [Chloroflexota bacterium]